MKKYLFWIWAFAQVPFLLAQNRIDFKVVDEDGKLPLVGATVRIEGTTLGATTDATGLASIDHIPDGKVNALISFVGYKKVEKALDFPAMNGKMVTVLLEYEEEEHEEVIVSSTRTSRTIEDVPTRVETIGGEEIDEKMNMRPTNVSMILHESTGIQVQQTSAASASQSIRIQGLDGRYTQILKDGFPSFGGFSNSLSVLDIPPLDLQQVEVIKGASSTLYGGDAIAGIVNFISKMPTDETHVSAILNVTSAKGMDANSYITGKIGQTRTQYSLLTTFNNQEAYDVDSDDFSELPQTKVFTISPKLYFNFSDKTKLKIGNTFTSQNRLGGDMTRIKQGMNGIHTYSEKNNSSRNLTTLQLDHAMKNGQKWVFKQSGSVFRRKISLADSLAFSGLQTHFYTDASWMHEKGAMHWVLGANLVRDQFDEQESRKTLKRDYLHVTKGLYAQNNWDISNIIKLESGLRLDHVDQYGTFLLPRFSVMLKPMERLVSRITWGMGYKTPTIFTEEAEALAFRFVSPIGSDIKAEKSLGGTMDVNYKAVIANEITLSFNQLAFYTKIKDPLVLYALHQNAFVFVNEQKPIVSKGLETNLKASYKMLKVFAGYTLTDARALYKIGNQAIVLVPRHKLNLMLLAEEHRNYKAGLEGYFTDRQWLTDGTKSPSYWELGLFLEKTWGKFSIFFNAENFTDTRQSRFEKVVLSSHEEPQFREIYTHTEGRTFNGGVKINL